MSNKKPEGLKADDIIEVFIKCADSIPDNNNNIWYALENVLADHYTHSFLTWVELTINPDTSDLIVEWTTATKNTFSGFIQVRFI